MDKRNDDILIEKITSAEPLTKCAALLAAVYNDAPWHEQWTEEKALERLLFIFNTPGFYGLMVVRDGVIIGCCVGNTEPYFSGDYFNLRELFVTVHSQRGGLGNLLMSSLKEDLELTGIRSIILLTSRKLFPFNFYRKAGFEALEDVCVMNYEGAD